MTDTKLSNGWMLAVAQEISGLKQEEFSSAGVGTASASPGR